MARVLRTGEYQVYDNIFSRIGAFIYCFSRRRKFVSDLIDGTSKIDKTYRSGLSCAVGAIHVIDELCPRVLMNMNMSYLLGLQLSWSIMWPFYLLFTKIFKLEEPRELGGDDLSSVEVYPFEKFLSERNCDASFMPHSQFIEVPHINQLQQWDCGLACVLMILATLGINGCHIQLLAELCGTTSIWTVDLAYLLQSFSVSFSYFTVTFGADPNYYVESFYKEELANDLVRVDKLFQKARELGIEIECKSISKEDFSLLMLSGIYIAIVLVDQHRLSRSWLKDVLVSGICDSVSSYTGHYIVVCGYDADADDFEIRDPDSTSKHVRISSKCLDDARKCFGTDEDILLVSLEKSRNQRTDSPQLSPNVNINC